MTTLLHVISIFFLAIGQVINSVWLSRQSRRITDLVDRIDTMDTRLACLERARATTRDLDATRRLDNIDERLSSLEDLTTQWGITR